MEAYLTPEIVITAFETEDVITTSGGEKPASETPEISV